VAVAAPPLAMSQRVARMRARWQAPRYPGTDATPAL